MNPILRSVLAVLAGLVTGFVIIAILEQVNSRIYPLPAGVDPMDLEALKKAIADIPTGALVNVLVGWAVGTFAGSWVAAAIGGRAHATHAFVVGAVLMAVAIVNMLILPHPGWFWCVALVMFLPLAWLGSRLARRGAAQA